MTKFLPSSSDVVGIVYGQDGGIMADLNDVDVEVSSAAHRFGRFFEYSRDGMKELKMNKLQVYLIMFEKDGIIEFRSRYLIVERRKKWRGRMHVIKGNAQRNDVTPPPHPRGWR